MNTDKILMMSVIACLSVISFIGFANAQPQVEVYPVVPSSMASVPDGYLYFYDFDMSTQNKTISLQSIDFTINSTDMLQYDISGSSVGVEGNYETIPLAKLGLYADQSDVKFFYNYTNSLTFIPDAKDPIGKFTLTLFTHWKFSTNIAVSATVHYLSSDGKKNTATSNWNFIKNIPDWNQGVMEPLIYCTNQTCPPANSSTMPEDKNQEILDALNVIKQQNAVLILEEAQNNKILADQYCDLHPEGNYLYDNGSTGEKVYSVSKAKCIADYLEKMN